MKRLLALLTLLILFVLPACGSTATVVQPPRSVPWQDGDTLLYDVLFRTEKVGEIEYVFSTNKIFSTHKETDVDEQIAQALAYDVNTLQAVSSTSFSQDTKTGNLNWQITTNYQNDSIDVTLYEYENGKETNTTTDTFPLPAAYPHDDGTANTLPQFLRLFPKPTEPYTLCLGQPKNFGQGGAMYQLTKISYYKSRDMAWNGEIVKTYGIRVGPAGSLRPASTVYWYSDDASRTLLQVDQGQIAYVLQGAEWIFR
ncbi:MAG: hypothetical protein FWD16_02255 [Clostridia bacterium]|nr:hypothetical protein [Clostridia bacterium]